MSPTGLLQPLPIPTQVWANISMDFIQGLPKAQGKNVILVVVDRLTKYAHFIPLSHPFTAKDVAESFIKEVVKLHGFPSTIVSDRDKIFLSNFWSELFKMAGTKLKFSSVYHPQTDGQTEVVNRCLETYLRCLTRTKPKQWTTWLGWAEFWFNTNYNSSLKLTPFKALYGRDPPHLLRGTTIPSAVEEVNQLTQERDQILHDLKDNLTKAQVQMKAYADRSRRAVTLSVGDWVYLKLQPYRLKSLAKKRNEKLSPRFYGPYQIKKQIGLVAFELDLPPARKIHPVFHASLLKKAVAATANPQPLPLMLSEDLSSEFFQLKSKLSITILMVLLKFSFNWKIFRILKPLGNPWKSSRNSFPHFTLRTR